MRCQEIKLENGKLAVIDHQTAHKCENCNKEVMFAVRMMKKFKVELVGLAQWDEHFCKDKYQTRLKLTSDRQRGMIERYG